MNEETQYQILPDNVIRAHNGLYVASHEIQKSVIKMNLTIKYFHKFETTAKAIARIMFYILYICELISIMKDLVDEILPPIKSVSDGLITRTDRLLN